MHLLSVQKWDEAAKGRWASLLGDVLVVSSSSDPGQGTEGQRSLQSDLL